MPPRMRRRCHGCRLSGHVGSEHGDSIIYVREERQIREIQYLLRANQSIKNVATVTSEVLVKSDVLVVTKYFRLTLFFPTLVAF
jgi:hypothetical protein